MIGQLGLTSLLVNEAWGVADGDKQAALQETTKEAVCLWPAMGGLNNLTKGGRGSEEWVSAETAEGPWFGLGEWDGIQAMRSIFYTPIRILFLLPEI